MICIILGTRPEVIKMSSVVRECQQRKLDFFIVHTNQHYSENLDKIFFEELELPRAKYNLCIGSGTHAEETGKMLIEIEKVLIKEKPDIVLVQGDTNTVLAGALAASKIRIKVAHIESGARSYCRAMPEEINRIVVDHISDYLFASVERDKNILLHEGIAKEKIFVVGNPIVDAVLQNVNIAQKRSKILNNLKLKKNEYMIVTAHRQENVDTKDKLEEILQGLELVHSNVGLPIIYPVHPRTQKRFQEFHLQLPYGVKAITPIGYFDFIDLQANARAVLTDSGGIQQESCILGVPCVTLRENTEWPDTVKVGSNILVGTNPQNILNGVKKMIGSKKTWENPFGDGESGKRILNIIKKI